MNEKKEYIERGALIAFVREVRKKLPKDSKDFFTRDEMLLNFQQYLELQKAADVEPVVRGEWKAAYISGLKVSDGAVCSKCDCWSARRSSFCPNCGAHMERSGSGE